MLEETKIKGEVAMPTLAQRLREEGKEQRAADAVDKECQHDDPEAGRELVIKFVDSLEHAGSFSESSNHSTFVQSWNLKKRRLTLALHIQFRFMRNSA